MTEIDDLRARLAQAEAERDAALARARESEAHRAGVPILEDAIRIVAGAEPGTPALCLVSSLVVQRDWALARLGRAVEVVRENEYVGPNGSCRSCGGSDPDLYPGTAGHDADCALAAVLRENGR